MPSPQEVELKLDLPARSLAKLTRGVLGGKAAGTATRVNLVSVYFDTRKFKLRRKGVSLRVRHIGGRHVQTIKQDAGALLDRQEWEREIPGTKPDLAAARKNKTAAVHCMKSASFGSFTHVTWDGWESPDLDCPPADSYADALVKDVEQIREASGIPAFPQR